jgi:transcriptional regulator with XRE-family HTH domain
MPSKHSSAPLPNRARILERFESRGISMRVAAAHLDVDHGHLSRVLHGDRPGSRALLESAAELAETIPPDEENPQDDTCRQYDICRLISAAAHLFFLKRGDFENELCNPAAQRRNNH